MATRPSDQELSRRELLRGLGMLTATASLPAVSLSGCANDGNSNPACVLTPRQTEGPFHLDVDLMRRDITEGKPGIPLLLALSVVEVGSSSCQPIEGAVVDVWHSDASGIYSGYVGQGDDGMADATGEIFLRGMQVTDSEGLAAFTTIYPGWYPGRTPHIHVEVYLSERSLVASQLYLPDHITDTVYAGSPYDARPARGVTNDNDSILLATSSREALFPDLVKNEVGYRASLTIGVAV